MAVEELGELTVDDPNIYREHKGGKGGELDIRAHTKSGEIYHVEVQVNPGESFGKRITYYNSRIYSGQLNSGEDYSELHRTITIVISNENFLKENSDYINRFQWYNFRNGYLLTDAQEINTLELEKLSHADDGTKLWKWLKLLKAGREDEMEELAKDSNAMKDVVVTLRKMSADESERRLAEWREKEERDRRSMLVRGRNEGEARGIQEIARRMKEENEPIEKIALYTGLSEEEIEKL